MKLRTAKFPSGDSVKARLKSSATASPLTANAVVFNPKISSIYAPQFNSSNGGSGTSRKKRSNNKGRSNNSNSNNNNGGNSNTKSKNNQQNGSNTSKRRGSKDNTKQTSSNDASKTRTKKVTMKAPSMGVSNFPSLPPTSDGNSKPFQVEKVPMDDAMLQGCGKGRHSAGGFSDSSSTATTSTASTPTEAPPSGVVSGGYAAALLKPAAPAPVTTKKAVVSEKSRQQPRSPSRKAKENANKVAKSNEGKIDELKQSIESNDQPSVTVQPPAWGQGRSFADIVSA